MSRQPPPIPSSIFNSNNFTSATDGTGTTPIPIPSRYVEFPVAQGANTLISTTINNSLTVGGTSTFNGEANFANILAPTSTATPLLNNDLTNKLYVDNQISGTLTLNDVLTNTLPFTAQQTFDSGIVVNNTTSTFNKLLVANNGINTTQITSPIGSLNIYTTGGNFTNINSPLSVSGASTFLSTLTTQNITGTDITLNANSLTTNTTILMKQNTYIPSTAGINFGDNFTGTTTNGNTFLSQGSGRFQIFNASNSTLTGQPTDIFIYSRALTGDPNPSTITLQTGTTPNMTLNKNLITMSTLTNFSLTPTAPNPSGSNPNELINYVSTQNLISSNAPNFAYINNANNFTNTNDFLLNPTTSATATLSTQIPNLQQIQALIAGGGVGSALLASANTFTAQNIFNNFAPQTPIAPTVNNSLINLAYLNTQLTNLRNIIPLKATQNFGPVSGDFYYTLTIDSWANYLIDDFITIRYSLSNNFSHIDAITPSSYTANSWGFCDIYPYRLGLGVGAPLGTNFSVLNNSFNGSTAYNLTSPSLPRGRWFWAYNNTNSTSYTNPALGYNGFYLYIQSVSGQQLNIGLYLPTPLSGSSYTSSFNIELISSLDNSKISTSSFLTNF